MKGLLLGAIIASASTLAADPISTKGARGKPPATAPRSRLAEPPSLSPLVRQLLKQRMHRHGADTLALVHAVLLLDHPTTERLAGELAAEPRLTRPIAGGADDLNAALPEQFFVLQDELRTRAQGLAEAARGADDAQLATRLGAVTQTCVGCHSAYLKPPTRTSAP